MMTKEEVICMKFLELMHEHGATHVKRVGPAIGPIVWKISRLPNVEWWKRYSRQMGFSYKDRYFKGRYSHKQGGILEIVEVVGREDGQTVVTIKGLDDAMKLDLKSRIDQFIHEQ